jgi:MFS transporter, FSR family, fosmidomycin resistance protein
MAVPAVGGGAMTPVSADGADRRADLVTRRRVLWITCSTHALHDGLTDALYVLLPVWQAQFALSYAAVGALRALYTAAMAGLQVPAAAATRWIGRSVMLSAGTAIAAAAFLLAGVGSGLFCLAVALCVAGIGSSPQHPIGSSLVAQAYDEVGLRGALATYNFAGDLGKMALPSLTALLIALMTWRPAVAVLGIVGISAAPLIVYFLRGSRGASNHPISRPITQTTSPGHGHYFALLLVIGIIDSATRMGFLTFLPFVLKAKGADLPAVGVALTLVFAGGAAGKLVCGLLGARLGVLGTVAATEGATALGILALLPMPIGAALYLLPIIGVALNGTSSVLYGTVPGFVQQERRDHAFGLFYTGTIGAGALAPAIYGLVSDVVGISATMALISGVVLFTVPLAWCLEPGVPPLASRS